MNNVILNAEGAINRLMLITLGDVAAIRTLERHLALLEMDKTSEVEDAIKTSPLGDDDDDDDDDDYMNNPRYQELLAAKRREAQEKFERLKNCGSHADALQPIVILMGDTSMIQEQVMKPFKERATTDEHYQYDLEFCKIHSSELTKNFASSLPKPKGKDGGVLIISDYSAFVDSYSPDDQRRILIDIMRTQGYTSDGIGLVCTGWRIIFLEDTQDKSKWWPYSCVQYFGNKNCLYSYYVE